MIGRWLKGRSRDPDVERLDWILDCAEHLLGRWGRDYFAEAPLVLPTDDYFPATGGGDAGRIQATFDVVVQQAGLEHWPVRLLEERKFSAIRALGETPHAKALGAVASGLRFDTSTEPPSYVVTYVEDDLQSPVGFVYHCATQLAAASVWDIDEVPGGDEAFWFLVDVAVCLMGFGVFACNASFICEGFTEGSLVGYWSQRRGTLSTTQFAAALAVFVRLRGLAPRAATAHLSPNPKAAFKRALKRLDREYAGRLDAIGRIEGPKGGELSFPFDDVGLALS